MTLSPASWPHLSGCSSSWLAPAPADCSHVRGDARRSRPQHTGVLMNKEMIISSSDHETRVAILEDDQVGEVFIERERSAASSATSTRAGCPRFSPACSPPSLTSASNATRSSTSPRSSLEDSCDDGRCGRESRGRGEGHDEGRGDPMEASGKRHPADGRASQTRPEGREEPQDRRPAERGAGMLVQVVKEPLGTKGARLTSHVSLAGPLPGLHADSRPRRRLAEDRFARGAEPPARHRP